MSARSSLTDLVPAPYDTRAAWTIAESVPIESTSRTYEREWSIFLIKIRIAFLSGVCPPKNAPDRFRTCDIKVSENVNKFHVANSLTLYRLSYRSRRETKVSRSDLRDSNT